MKLHLLFTSGFTLLLAQGLLPQEDTPTPEQGIEHKMLQRLVGRWSFTFADHLSDSDTRVMAKTPAR